MFYTETITIDNRSWLQRRVDGFKTWCEVVGYARAASHLSTLGFHEELKKCMMEIARLKHDR